MARADTQRVAAQPEQLLDVQAAPPVARCLPARHTRSGGRGSAAGRGRPQRAPRASHRGQGLRGRGRRAACVRHLTQGRGACHGSSRGASFTSCASSRSESPPARTSCAPPPARTSCASRSESGCSVARVPARVNRWVAAQGRALLLQLLLLQGGLAPGGSKRGGGGSVTGGSCSRARPRGSQKPRRHCENTSKTGEAGVRGLD